MLDCYSDFPYDDPDFGQVDLSKDSPRLEPFCAAQDCWDLPFDNSLYTAAPFQDTNSSPTPTCSAAPSLDLPSALAPQPKPCSTKFWELQPTQPRAFTQQAPAQRVAHPEQQLRRQQQQQRQQQQVTQGCPPVQASAPLVGRVTPAPAEAPRQSWSQPARQQCPSSQQAPAGANQQRTGRSSLPAPQQQQQAHIREPAAPCAAGSQQQGSEPALAAHHRRMALLQRYWSLKLQPAQTQHAGAVPDCGAPAPASLPARAASQPAELAAAPAAAPAAASLPFGATPVPSGLMPVNCARQNNAGPAHCPPGQGWAERPPPQPTSPQLVAVQPREASLDSTPASSPPHPRGKRWGSGGLAVPSNPARRGPPAVSPGPAAVQQGLQAKRSRPSGAQQGQQAKRPKREQQQPRAGSKGHILSLSQENVELRNEIRHLKKTLHLWASQGYVTPEQALHFLDSLPKQANC